jgi:murein DD-endopeptidase MepM/ murein hydrolase activator NlpD
MTAGIGSALWALVLVSPSYAADTGGAGNGGLTFVATPEIANVSCVSACASKKRVRGGSTIRLSGSNLAAVNRVVFMGGRTSSDDASVKVRSKSDRALTLRVPLEAPSGPLKAYAGDAARSKATEALKILPPPPPPPPTGKLTPVPEPAEPGAPKLETGMSTSKLFVGSRYGVTFSYRVSDSQPVSVQVDLVHLDDGAVVRTWTPPPVTPGEVQNVSWKGFVGAATAPEGRYAFRLSASGHSGMKARSAQLDDSQRDAFDVRGHIFPVRAPHDYGQAAARFGAGRDGHSHQGQDVFANCGSRLVAARGGQVKFEQYHSAAGYYLVIDGDKTDVDYAYMHLQAPSPFDVGDRIATGQEIGRVGDTGDAEGCHLHFEMWTGPGWYDGGKPFDPLPYLQAWDAWS